VAALCNGAPAAAGATPAGGGRRTATFGDGAAAQVHLSSGDTTPTGELRLLAGFPPAAAQGGADVALSAPIPGGSASGDNTSGGYGGSALARPGAEAEHPLPGQPGASGEGGCSPTRADSPPLHSQAAQPHTAHAQPHGDPFLVAAAGAMAAAASGRASAAWRSASAAERVALLGRRWYGADYPTASSGADTAQGAAIAPAAAAACLVGMPSACGQDGVQQSQPAAFLPPAAFAKPPRLILRTDGSIVAAPPQDSSGPGDGGDVSFVAPRAPRRRPSAAQLAQQAVHEEVAGRPLWSSKALAPLLHYPIPPHRSLAAVAQHQPQAYQQQQQSHARVPTAPRSRTATARRASWNASTIAAPAAQQQQAPSHLDAVLDLTRRGPGGGASQSSRVPGPGAGLPGSANARAAPPSFAFELLPRMVPLSRHNVKADMRAIASAAEALFAMAGPSPDEGPAKRMRLVGAA
jgi:hypothetical protein